MSGSGEDRCGRLNRSMYKIDPCIHIYIYLRVTQYYHCVGVHKPLQLITNYEPWSSVNSAQSTRSKRYIATCALPFALTSWSYARGLCRQCQLQAYPWAVINSRFVESTVATRNWFSDVGTWMRHLNWFGCRTLIVIRVAIALLSNMDESYGHNHMIISIILTYNFTDEWKPIISSMSSWQTPWFAAPSRLSWRSSAPQSKRL